MLWLTHKHADVCKKQHILRNRHYSKSTSYCDCLVWMHVWWCERCLAWLCGAEVFVPWDLSLKERVANLQRELDRITHYSSSLHRDFIYIISLHLPLQILFSKALCLNKIMPKIFLSLDWSLRKKHSLHPVPLSLPLSVVLKHRKPAFLSASLHGAQTLKPKASLNQLSCLGLRSFELVKRHQSEYGSNSKVCKWFENWLRCFGRCEDSSTMWDQPLNSAAGRPAHKMSLWCLCSVSNMWYRSFWKISFVDAKLVCVGQYCCTSAFVHFWQGCTIWGKYAIYNNVVECCENNIICYK